YLCSKLAFYFLKHQNPTLNFQVENIAKLPWILGVGDEKQRIDTLTKETINISRNDWNSFETSWDFIKHPLLKFPSKTIESSFNQWNEFAESKFNQLKENEEELNRIFIDIYGLQDELTPDVAEEDVTVNKA